jgi:hypothetical protein
VKREVEVKSKKRGKLTIQCDEMWSFVGNKGNKQWIWLAIDVLTKEIVGVYSDPKLDVNTHLVKYKRHN